jgi:hypothetical protein
MANENQEFLVSSRAEEEVEKERQRIEKLVHEAERFCPRLRRCFRGLPSGRIAWTMCVSSSTTRALRLSAEMRPRWSRWQSRWSAP